MTNITPIYWEFNGESLHTYRWAIDTFGGGRYTPASKRGDDVQVPFRHGRVRTKKTRDSRAVPVNMWLDSVDEDGANVPGLTPEQVLHDNWNDLMDLLSTEDQAELVKRWWDGDTVKSATAMAEVLEFPEASSSGYLQRFGFDFQLADPWFYGDLVTEAAGAITVQGNEMTTKAIFDLTVTGPARVDMSDTNWFQYLGGAGHLIVNGETGLATLGGVPVNGLMRRNFDFWNYAEFKPGALTVAFTSGISAGSVKYNPAWR